MRYAQLHERLASLGVERINDLGNLAVPIREAVDEVDRHAKYYDGIEKVCKRLAEIVERSVREGALPIVLGGDHSVAMGTLDGLTRARGSAPGVVWIDAHSDINDPEHSPSGNVHGMPLWFALRSGFADPKRTVQIGLRDVDPLEKENLRRSGVPAFTMSDVDRLG